MVEIIAEELRDVLRVDNQFVGYANKSVGDNASIVVPTLSRSQLGEIVQALDRRDNGDYPDRKVFVVGGGGAYAKELKKYDN